MLTHFSLFTGIGGIDLAAEWAGFKTVGQCEFADYPTKVLEKHWKDVPRWRDVRDVTNESIRERGIEEITLLSGGFPCQPHSVAGKRKASTDERDLWPEYKRIISETNPKWILGENVSGLLTSEHGQFFRGILRDLHGLGYDVGWCTIRASWVGALHRRERLFIIAHTSSIRWSSLENDKQIRCTDINYENYKKWLTEQNNILSAISWTYSEPISGIHRNDDGISEGVDRIKCLGNAVVPQQVYPILKAIHDIEMGR
ncbi:MAG: DNA cytosine methyltransferase [Ignavibacteriales bacterium]